MTCLKLIDGRKITRRYNVLHNCSSSAPINKTPVDSFNERDGVKRSCYYCTAAAVAAVVPAITELYPESGWTEVAQGDSLELTCRASGRPEPVISWTHRQSQYTADVRPSLRLQHKTSAYHFCQYFWLCGRPNRPHYGSCPSVCLSHTCSYLENKKA